MIQLNGQSVYANQSKQVGRLTCERDDKRFYTVTRPTTASTPPAPAGPVVLMTWGRPRDEPRPRRPSPAGPAVRPPPVGETRPRRLSCCQVVAAVSGLLVFYVLLLMAILYATGSVALLSDAGRHAADARPDGQQSAPADPAEPEGHRLDRIAFLHSPSGACSGAPPYIAAFVHSAPAHARHRDVIRRTWGGVAQVDGAGVRVLFVVGRAPALQSLLEAESRRYGDLIQADFDDSYRNLTTKHLLGLRWMLRHCAGARFLLKADDDAFVDVFQLVRFMRRTHGDAAPGALVCNVLPAGTPVQRRGKWAVTRAEFAADAYPRFCGGLLYLAAPQTAARLYGAALAEPRPLWVDDAFVTGVLAARVGVDHFYMNLRYTYDAAELLRWLRDSPPRPLPYMVGHMDTGSPDWAETARKLWQKTLSTSRLA